MKNRVLSLLLSFTLIVVGFCFPDFSLNVSADSNEQIIYNYCINDLGLNTAAACGVLANIEKESSFNPKSSCKDTNGLTSYGICQWNGPRFESLKSFCSNNGYDYTTIGAQLEYLKYELTGSYKYVLNSLKEYSNTEDGSRNAALYWAARFEVCAQKYRAARGELAVTKYWPKYGVIIIPDFEVDYSFPTPFDAYPQATSGLITLYDRNLNAYATSTRNIAYDDLCTIEEVYSNGYCKVTYPTPSGKNTELTLVSEFIPNAINKYCYSTSQNVNAYMRSDLSQLFGTVFSTDSCTVVGQSGNKLQLIYPIDGGGYKLAWIIPPSDPIPSDFVVPLYGYIDSPAEKAIVYETVNTLGVNTDPSYGKIFVDDKCTLNVVNVNGGWIYVNYPISGGTKNGYVYMDQFIPSNSRLSVFYEATVSQQTDTFRKSNMADKYGYVSVGDMITVIGKADNRLQVIYPLDSGGYKLAWIYDTYVNKTLSDIFVESNPSKTRYLEGDEFTSSGLSVKARFNDGTTSDITSKCSLSGYDSTPGTKTINVSYDGKETAFTVFVEEKTLTGIELVSLPTKTTVDIGAEIDLTGLKIKASFNNGSSSEIEDYYIDNFDVLDTIGDKTLIIKYSYNGVTKSCELPITVEHVFGEWYSENEATCGKPGTQKRKCKGCGFEEEREITALEHDYYAEKIVEPTCTEKGYTVYVCRNCNSTYNDNYVDALGHKYTETVIAPTRDTEGYTLHKCTVCEDSYKDNYTPAIEDTDSSSNKPDITEYKVGDINGDGKVNMKDVTRLHQYINGWDVEISEQTADVNGDGKINMKDVTRLHQFINGWDVKLYVKENNISTDNNDSTDTSTSIDLPTETDTDTEQSYSVKKVYGQSELGRDLIYYDFQPAEYSHTVLLNFAIHGFEDEYDADGQVLVDTANKLVEYYNESYPEGSSTRLIVVPCANPDGLYEGTTNDGFGRCNANGVDLNRDFDANYKSYSTPRNYTQTPFSAAESRALRDLYNEVNPDVVIDFHGWLNYTIGNYELAQVFEDELGLPHYVNFTTTNASGYFSNWAYQQGSLGLLVEFTSSTSVDFDKLINAVDRLIDQDYLMSKQSAEYESFDQINCYTISKERVTTYKYFDKPYDTASYIDGETDLVVILGVYENGWAKVQYPINNGYKVAYCKTNELIDTASNTKLYKYDGISGKTTVYKRSDLSESFGTVYSSDECYVVSKTETALQVIYTLDNGGWKMGWIERNGLV